MNADASLSTDIAPIPEGARLIGHTMADGLTIGGYDAFYSEGLSMMVAQPVGIFLGVLVAGQTTSVLVENVGAMRIPVGQPVIMNFSEQVNCTNSYSAGEHYAGVGLNIPPEFLTNSRDEHRKRELAPLLKFFDRPTDMEVFQHSTEISELASQIIAIDQSKPGMILHLEGLTFMLLSAFCGALARASDRVAMTENIKHEEWQRVKLISDYLDENLAMTPSLKDLARKAGINQTTLSEHFKVVHGETIFSYLRNKRLETAREILRRGNASVTETSFQVGFASSTSFTTAFRRRFGYPPSQELTPNLDCG